MRVWRLVGRSPFPPSSSGKAREGSRRIPTADAIIEGSRNYRGRFVHNNGRMDNTFLICGGENHRFTTTMDRVVTRQEVRRLLRGSCTSFTYFPLFAVCDGGGRFLPGLKGILFSFLFTAGDSASLLMPRGGRHAGGAHTSPNGMQGQPRNSSDYHYFGNGGGDDGGSPPLGRTSIGACRRTDR
ncbi:hypothetical protein TCDM_13135 [Trypanosoma cruzi Dm28c]|uniref:Uncharacterized protein n=1 Tax=Trypanosoma cruzi Dm28c TaxID=1416333 RepID=V5AJF3_TRYCR|nr:hypothetical protein TCDM_13135 [Trypanosoma cruzi Dm28c]